MRTAEMNEEFARNVALDVLREAFSAGKPATWERRAEQFEAARQRHGDFLGELDFAGVLALDERIAAKAYACRQRAAVERYADDGDLSHLLTVERPQANPSIPAWARSLAKQHLDRDGGQHLDRDGGQEVAA